MQLEIEHFYDASLEQVLGAFFDEAHIREKNQRLGFLNIRVPELTRDDMSAKVVVEREMTASTDVPGILASFHREWNQVRQEEHWFRKDDGEWHCEFRVRIEGVPARIKGNMRLQGTDEDCINYVTLNVDCEVPLVGKKIARFLTDDSHTKIENEYRITCQLL